MEAYPFLNYITTISIIIATCLVSYKVMESPSEKMKLVFSPYYIKNRKEYARFLTSGLIHGDWFHLIFNMYVLYSFGKNVEIIYKAMFGMAGQLLFLALYIGGIICAHIPNYIRHKDNPGYASLGASGAVSGVLFSSILFDPWGGIGFVFIPGLWIPGFLIGILYLAYSSYMSKKNRGRIDHTAHLAGAIFGFLFTLALNPSIIFTFMECLMNGTEACYLKMLGI